MHLIQKFNIEQRDKEQVRNKKRIGMRKLFIQKTLPTLINE